jgi:hypothetical protein
MNSVDEIFSRIRAISWFEHIGKAVSIQLPFAFRSVPSWDVARLHYQSIEWENITLNAQGDLSAFLCVRHRDRYRHWNEITIAARDGFLRPLLAERVVAFQQTHNLPESFVHCVSWDLLGAIMEFAYRDLPLRPTFFLDLLTVYEAGHFPCGWSGTPPEGELLLY